MFQDIDILCVTHGLAHQNLRLPPLICRKTPNSDHHEEIIRVVNGPHDIHFRECPLPLVRCRENFVHDKWREHIIANRGKYANNKLYNKEGYLI